MRQADLAVIGGGPAGLAAAIEARKRGIEDILILEREEELGGILRQCIHNGFGLHVFGEELTGPEYAWRFIDQVHELGISYSTGTMVIDISDDKVISAINSQEGYFKIKAKAIVLAMGCRERTRGALNIPGTRPAGIYTAGTAQRFVNMDGYLPGKKIVILGSGDIGLIMARRMTLEGAEVKMVCELLPYSGGLQRNIVQCLNDYQIPLKLNHTVIKIHGRERLEAVTIAQVDERRKPILETAQTIECDTLLLSVGLIPENELTREAGISIDPVTSGPVVDNSMETSLEGVFACGNVVQVHDLVDYVTEEATLAGQCAARYLQGEAYKSEESLIKTLPGKGVRYIVPQTIGKASVQEAAKLFFRVDHIYENIAVRISCDDQPITEIKKRKVSPGEMEQVKIKKKVIDEMNDGGILTIEIVKEGAAL